MSRPLCGFSDFVVETFPHLLATSKEAAAQGAEQALLALDSWIVEAVLASDERQLAGFDLKFVEWGLYHAGAVVPDRLVELVNRFAGDSCSGLTYEELVLLNPINDMRLFTCGEHGETERLFYRNHREIEEILADLIDELRKAIQAGSLAKLDGRRISEAFSTITEKTDELSAMADGHFHAFRQYFKPHDSRSLKGPSGAFSARFPILELLFEGAALPEERFAYIETNQQYFPRCDAGSLRAAVESARRGDSIRAVATSSARDRMLVTLFETFFETWRKRHLRAVARQLPEVFSGKEAGTGGEVDARAFLSGRMKNRKE